MRLKQAEVQENRRRIIDTAGRLFRKRGFDGVGVAELMAAAGFTHGGFYNHFQSKEALASAAAADSLGRSNQVLSAELERGGRRALRSYLGRYLSPQHRDHPDTGCTLAALSADAGRQGAEVQSSFARAVHEVLSLIGGVLAGRGGRRRLEGAREEALRTYSEIVGAMVLSRAVKDADPALSDEILAASRKALG